MPNQGWIRAGSEGLTRVAAPEPRPEWSGCDAKGAHPTLEGMMRTRAIIRAVANLAFLLTVACAPAMREHPSNEPALQSSGMPLTGRSSDRITAGELAGVGGINALEALHRLRPELVRSSAPGGIAPSLPVLYLNGARHGRMDLLATMSAGIIREMRYYRPEEARARFGPLAGDGVLYVTTRR